METIVVGVDGSESSQRALEWAAAEARLRNARLRVVLAWFEVFVSGWFATSALYYSEEIRQAAQDELDKAVASIPAGSPEIEVESVLAHTSPELALIEESKHASLVVVGSRGRGGFAGLVLGSTSHQVVQHAECPVVVIR